jgi:hypothetical protein
MTYSKLLNEKSPSEILLFLIQNGKDVNILDYFGICPEAFHTFQEQFNNRPIVFAFIGTRTTKSFLNCAHILNPSLRDAKGNTWMHHCAWVCSFLSNTEIAKNWIDAISSFAPDIIHSLNDNEETPLDVFIQNRISSADWKTIALHLSEKGFSCNKYPPLNSADMDASEKSFLRKEKQWETQKVEEEKRKREERMEISMKEFTREREEIIARTTQKYAAILHQRKLEQDRAERERQKAIEEANMKAQKETKARRKQEEMMIQAKNREEEAKKELRISPPVFKAAALRWKNSELSGKKDPFRMEVEA